MDATPAAPAMLSSSLLPPNTALQFHVSNLQQFTELHTWALLPPSTESFTPVYDFTFVADPDILPVDSLVAFLLSYSQFAFQIRRLTIEGAAGAHGQTPISVCSVAHILTAISNASHLTLRDLTWVTVAHVPWCEGQNHNGNIPLSQLRHLSLDRIMASTFTTPLVVLNSTLHWDSVEVLNMSNEGRLPWEHIHFAFPATIGHFRVNLPTLMVSAPDTSLVPSPSPFTNITHLVLHGIHQGHAGAICALLAGSETTLVSMHLGLHPQVFGTWVRSPFH